MNTNGTLRDQAVIGAEALSLIIREHDSLLTQNDRMTAELAQMRERVDQLESRLRMATAERDHYMKYSVELTTGLTNINVLIASTLEESRQSAYRPAAAPGPIKPIAVSAEDAKQLENLIGRLPKHEE
jgi:hypothetical protein